MTACIADIVVYIDQLRWCWQLVETSQVVLEFSAKRSLLCTKQILSRGKYSQLASVVPTQGGIFIRRKTMPAEFHHLNRALMEIKNSKVISTSCLFTFRKPPSNSLSLSADSGVAPQIPLPSRYAVPKFICSLAKIRMVIKSAEMLEGIQHSLFLYYCCLQTTLCKTTGLPAWLACYHSDSAVINSYKD